MAKVRRRDVPPGEDAPIYLVSCPKEGAIRVRFLDDWKGVLIHKPKPKDQIPCADPEKCPGSLHKGKTQWRGYAPAEWYREAPHCDWCPCVFEVTSACGEKMQRSVLRGSIFRFERGKGDGGPNEVVCHYLGEKDPDKLGPTFSVLPTLARVFGTIHIALGLPPLYPSRLILPPVKDDPPPDLADLAQQKTLQELSARDLYKQQLAAGKLPASVRKALPGLIAELERELGIIAK